jgi:hypothetical protein
MMRSKYNMLPALVFQLNTVVSLTCAVCFHGSNSSYKGAMVLNEIKFYEKEVDHNF